MRVEIGQIVAQIIAFLIMLWVLKRYAWQPLLNVLDDRRAKIQADFDALETHKKELNRLENEYHDKLSESDAAVKVILKQANEKGVELFKEIEQEAQIQAKAIISDARAELQKEVHKAKIQLKDEIVKIALSATEKVIQTSMDSEKQKKIIADFVDQAETH